MPDVCAERMVAGGRMRLGAVDRQYGVVDAG
jgi:hypothetical protein